MTGVSAHGQKNKKHKTGRHDTKGQRHKHKEQKAGKHILSVKTGGARGNALRADRLANAKKLRDQRRSDTIQQRRGALATPPKVVALVLLSDDVDVHRVWTMLMDASHSDEPSALVDKKNTTAVHTMKDNDDDDAPPPLVPGPLCPTTVVMSGRTKGRITWLPPSRSRLDPLELVELGKAADTVLLLCPRRGTDVTIDVAGDMALKTLMALGMPSTIVVAAPSINDDAAAKEDGKHGKHVPPPNMKDRAASKKTVTAAVNARLAGDLRVMHLDTDSDAATLLRATMDVGGNVPVWRQQRPYLMIQSATIVQTQPPPPPSSSTSLSSTPATCVVRVEGYVRGLGLSANQVVHVPGAGDFHIARITAPRDPNTSSGRNGGNAPTTTTTTTTPTTPTESVVMESSLTTRHPLDRENNFDPLAADQTFITEEEIAAAEAAREERRKSKKVPRGTSDYQAAWIPDEDNDRDDEEEEDGLSDLDEDEMEDDGEDEEDEDDKQRDDKEGGDDDDEKDWVELNDAQTDIFGDELHSDQEETEEDVMAAKALEMKRRRKEAEDDVDYPDEKDTPIDHAARLRFAKYRGLKSFRTSTWDAKESLPVEYARIYAFENFRRTWKRAVASSHRVGLEEPGALPGMYIAVELCNVPRDVAEWMLGRVQAALQGDIPPLVAFGLLLHECKLSVNHYSLRLTPNQTTPLRSKERLLFCTGVRTFPCQPVFSTDEHGADKFKLERYLHPGRQCVASVYAPISYPPGPLLVFRMPSADEENDMNGDGNGGNGGGGGSMPHLVATGTLKSCDPDRVVLKKIILTGFPVKVHKRRAVVKHMFYNPEDVKWFKPLEVWTKYGRRGRIQEAVGTKGSMKIIFDGVVQQRDTICVSLYKRSFPKWPVSMTFA